MHLRKLAAGLGAGVALLLTAAPAVADEPMANQDPVATTTPAEDPPVTSTPAEDPPVTSTPAEAPLVTPAPTTPAPTPGAVPSEQVPTKPTGGVQTGGGSVADDSTVLIAGAAGLAVAGLGGVLLRRRAAGKAG